MVFQASRAQAAAILASLAIMGNVIETQIAGALSQAAGGMPIQAILSLHAASIGCAPLAHIYDIATGPLIGTCAESMAAHHSSRNGER